MRTELAAAIQQARDAVKVAGGLAAIPGACLGTGWRFRAGDYSAEAGTPIAAVHAVIERVLGSVKANAEKAAANVSAAAARAEEVEKLIRG